MTSNITPEGAPVNPSAAVAPVAPAKKSKVRRNVLLAGGAVGLVGIGSTLAANISLNGGNNVEFGQGVARTTACDADGFTINPVASYDNEYSIWRLDRVDITGLNLTPVGTGFLDAGYTTQDDAKIAHPGEYYDNGTWKRTCDGIVLDFKAYTDDVDYWTSTLDAFLGNPQSISTPIGWAQWEGNYDNYPRRNSNFGFAVVFDTNDDNNGQLSNWGVQDAGGYGPALTTWASLDHSVAASSSFSFSSSADSFGQNQPWRPNAASISKIAVSSMAHFPGDYSVDDSGGIGRG